MDPNILSTIRSVITTEWGYFFAAPATNLYNFDGPSRVYIGPAQFMAYAGAGISFFVSCMGAYQAASQVVTDVEKGMDNFLT